MFCLPDHVPSGDGNEAEQMNTIRDESGGVPLRPEVEGLTA
jgi:hypothetical protein